MGRDMGRYEVLKQNCYIVVGLFSFQNMGRDLLCHVCGVSVVITGTEN